MWRVRVKLTRYNYLDCRVMLEQVFIQFSSETRFNIYCSAAGHVFFIFTQLAWEHYKCLVSVTCDVFNENYYKSRVTCVIIRSNYRSGECRFCKDWNVRNLFFFPTKNASIFSQHLTTYLLLAEMVNPPFFDIK